MDKHAKRRLALLVSLTLLAAVGGFIWGRQYGYDQGKADTMKAIEEGLNRRKQVVWLVKIQPYRTYKLKKSYAFPRTFVLRIISQLKPIRMHNHSMNQEVAEDI